jgi:uncharacterized membrane protein
MYLFRPGLSKLILSSVWLLVFVVCLLAPFAPTLVASFYTQGIFRYGASGLRFLFGWIPFAIGEFVYLIILISLIINALRHINSINPNHIFPTSLQVKEAMKIVADKFEVDELSLSYQGVAGTTEGKAINDMKT